MNKDLYHKLLYGTGLVFRLNCFLQEVWIKMQQIVPTSQGDINIHYVYNQTLKIFDDFKFNP